VVDLSSGDVEDRMLEELQKIREAVEPKPAPPAEPAMGFRAEFRGFLEKRNIIGLALAVIIGGAAGKLVSALVGDILMPVLAFFLPGGEWRVAEISLGNQKILIGHFMGSILDFLVIALVIFMVMKQLEKVGLQ
jgi:large conductance mechanosensitive channel